MKKNVNDPLKIKGIIYFCIDDSVLEKSDISKKDLFSEDFPEKESTKTLITKYSCPFLRTCLKSNIFGMIVQKR